MTTTSDQNVEDTLTASSVTLPSQLRQEILENTRAEVPAPAPAYQLAQMNTARFRHPMDHPDMAGFVEMLDPINHQADVTEGCVWRLTDEGSNNATSIEFYDDPRLLVNLSVWTDVSSLRNYVYRTEHVEMVKRREEWADAMESVYIVLWWVPAGHLPDVAEGDAKLQLLREQGPSPDAFTFATVFPPPG